MQSGEENIFCSLNQIVKYLNEGNIDLAIELFDKTEQILNSKTDCNDFIINFRKFIKQYLNGAMFLKAIASGNLDVYPPDDPLRQNFVISQYKQLHSNLRHLTWQTQQIAKGDLKQKVSFLGEFSIAFNTMIESLREKKHLEEKNAIQFEQLQKLNATKDKFFSIIAHDLKSPFSSILGFSEILKDEVEQIDTKTIKRYASLINSSAQNSYALLENLLEWARMQQGQIQFEPENLALNDAVIAEIQNLQYSADLKKIKLTNNTPENLTIKADYNMLLTILRNLISNAIKFTPEGGQVKVEAKIEGEVKGEKSQVVISVSDTGIGMTKETIENLFKIESSISTRGTNNERGTGIGLLLCKDFIEKHKGNIAVKSMPGKGSTFTIYLPK